MGRPALVGVFLTKRVRTSWMIARQPWQATLRCPCPSGKIYFDFQGCFAVLGSDEVQDAGETADALALSDAPGDLITLGESKSAPLPLG